MKISLSYPEPYLINVTLEIDTERLESFHLQLAAWRPGRYELANFGQYLYPLSSNNAKIIKVTKDHWEIAPEDGLTIIEYQFYANQPDAGGSLITDDFIYLNPINFIPKLEGYNRDYTLNLNTTEDYTFATSLRFEKSTLTADSYEQLIDSPIIASKNIKHKAYTVNNARFHIWIQGNVNPDWSKLIDRFKSFTKEQIRIFGEFPAKDYHFLNIIHPFKHYHGVEHLNSTTIVLGPDTEFDSKKMQLDFLGISSHELFHFWNIKRIMPEELIPLNLSKEIYFNTGLIAEGLTTYYGDYILGRTNVFSQEEYFNEINLYLKRHFQNFGRTKNSITESSMDLWLDGYKIGIPNRKVSIYIKGALISLIIDLEIRKKSKNEFSLDNVIKDLWLTYGDGSKGYSLDGYIDILLNYLPDSKNLINQLFKGKESILPQLKRSLEYIGCSIKEEKNENELCSKYGILINPKNNLIFKIDPESKSQLAVSDEVISINEKSYDQKINSYLKEIHIVTKRYGIEKKSTLKATEKHYFKEYRITQHVKSGAAYKNFCTWLNK